MNKAVGWMMPRQLRKLFLRILVHCQPLHSEELWESFKVAMSEDYVRHFGILQGQKRPMNKLVLCFLQKVNVSLIFHKWNN